MDLNTDHLNTELFEVRFQMVGLCAMCYVLKRPFQYWTSTYSVHLSGIRMVSQPVWYSYGIQILDHLASNLFGPFECLNIFRSHCTIAILVCCCKPNNTRHSVSIFYWISKLIDRSDQSLQLFCLSQERYTKTLLNIYHNMN